MSQITIPFELENHILARSSVRTVSTAMSDYMRKVDLQKIRIRPGFNARIKPEGMAEIHWEEQLGIPELAEAIFQSNGPAEPILGDFYMGDECFYITNGERRYRALSHLVANNRFQYPNGEAITNVTVILNPPGTTDLERKRKVITTQDNLKLTPMQKAFYYKSFVDQDKMTHEAIGKFLNVSRQTVDNYILLTALPKEVQDRLDAGEINTTEALKIKRTRMVEVDEDTGEVTEGKKPGNVKVDGDEDEFEQQDNSKTFAGSKNMPEDKGSGAITPGVDSIYMQEQKKALWKQFWNRIKVLKEKATDDVIRECYDNLSFDALHKADEKVIMQLMNEYDLKAK